VRSNQLSIQGHRGARGHYPENTVRGFLEALRFGVNTIELDVVITGDQQVLVSHEAWMNDLICSLPDGAPIKAGNGQDYNLYKMPYSEIKQFDCGKRGNPEFPFQHPLPAYKPLLSEVFIDVEKEISQKKLFPVIYNIELKTEVDILFNPDPPIFADLVYREIIKYLPIDRVNIQSFDNRLLKEMRKMDEKMSLGLLVENNNGPDVNLQQLGFIPDTYNPEFILVDENLVNVVHSQGMKLVPWTVNEISDMKRLLKWGVDGIITDYPDRLVNLLKRDN